MADIVVNEGVEAALNLIRSNASWTVAPYSNTPTISEDSVKADFTLSAWSGSTPIALNSWGAVSVSSDKAQMVHDPVSWELGEAGPFNINGAIVYNGSNKLIMVMPFATTRVLTNDGDQLLLNSITFKLYDQSFCA